MEYTGENGSPDLVRLHHHQSTQHSCGRGAISNLLGTDNMQQRSACPGSSTALSAAHSRRYIDTVRRPPSTQIRAGSCTAKR